MTAAGRFPRPGSFFPGQVFDAEAGWFYNWSRDYNPALGRYVQSDPIGLDGDSLSTYAYVSADPAELVDPDGLQAQVPACAVGSVLGPAGCAAAAGVATLVTGAIIADNINKHPLHLPSSPMQDPGDLGIPPGLISALPPDAAADVPACFAEEHTTNRRASNWDKHTKPRPGRDSEKKRNKPGWKPNQNKPK